jgi:hypothetical protein
MFVRNIVGLLPDYSRYIVFLIVTTVRLSNPTLRTIRYVNTSPVIILMIKVCSTHGIDD